MKVQKQPLKTAVYISLQVEKFRMEVRNAIHECS